MIEKTPPLPWEITSKEVNLEEIQAASKRISSIVPPTPVSRSIFQSDLHSLNVWLKLENFNVTGSFKIRGAANSLTSLMKEDMASGVIAASAGNHAQGIAYVSKILGIKSKIFMPERTPLNKVEATRAQGAEVILNGAIYDDAFTLAQAEQKSSGGLLVHAFSDAATINGQGTAGLEILQQIPNVGAVIIPVGGGGLCGGVACAIKSINPKVKIIGVQTKSFPAMKSARDSGFIEPMVFGTTIADGIAVKRPSPRTLSLSLKYVDELVTVSEDEIAASIMSLMEKDHILAEGAGAVGIAALQNVAANLRKELGSEPICIIISGGNIDVTLLSR
ncbi:MAG: threonine/serine dehydratase, partial [Proteobacteria bacterium]|nr:threonine/serine dehydratase [Pseudomonadota bacterium]